MKGGFFKLGKVRSTLFDTSGVATRDVFLAKWEALWRKFLLGWGGPLNLGGLTFVVYSYCLCIRYISKGLAI